MWKYEKQYPKRIFVLKIWEMIRKEITIANFMTIICLNRGKISHEINYFRTINIFWISKVHMTAKRQLFYTRYSIFFYICNVRLTLIVTRIYFTKYNSTRYSNKLSKTLKVQLNFNQNDTMKYENPLKVILILSFLYNKGTITCMFYISWHVIFVGSHEPLDFCQRTNKFLWSFSYLVFNLL